MRHGNTCKSVRSGSGTLAAVQSSQPGFYHVSPCATYTTYTLYLPIIHTAMGKAGRLAHTLHAGSNAALTCGTHAHWDTWDRI